MKQAEEAEDRLREQAMIDDLTGIFNRGEVLSRTEEEISRINRQESDEGNRELSLILIDLDHFKKVNDTYGHQAGDSVLRQVVDRIKKELRPYDIFGRYGGEEFLLVLPSASLMHATVVAERVRKIVAEQPITFKEQTLSVTISLGVSSITPDSNLIEAIRQADQALYFAKENGRNQVEFQTT